MQWQEIFKEIKSNDLYPRLLYPAKLSLRQIESIPDKKKLRELITTRQVLKEMLEISLKRRKRKYKNMNSKTEINIYLSTTKSKKQNK